MLNGYRGVRRRRSRAVAAQCRSRASLARTDTRYWPRASTTRPVIRSWPPVMSSSTTADGVQISILRKLRRGQYRVQAEIDLHGLTVAEAKVVLRDFLAEALHRQFKCVRIIHGQGATVGAPGTGAQGSRELRAAPGWAP